jgi:hypothetical protein
MGTEKFRLSFDTPQYPLVTKFLRSPKKKGMSYVYANPVLQRKVFEKKLVVVRLTIKNY